MRRCAISSYFCACLSTLCVIAISKAANASGEIATEPQVITPGQTVKLKWYFTGNKVVVSGGRFGTGTVVTGKTLITDAPHKTTRYTFDVYYNGTETNEKGEKVTKPIHAQYTVVANVDTSPPDHYKTYADTHGWKIGYIADWRKDASPSESSDESLIFFQKELDSVERMAVAMLPANGMTAEEIISKALADAPSHYEQVSSEPTTTVTLCGRTGAMTVFSGNDNTHDHLRTTSLLYTIVCDGRAYVISARTRASEFPVRKLHLDNMMHSFSLPSASTQQVSLKKNQS